MDYQFNYIEFLLFVGQNLEDFKFGYFALKEISRRRVFRPQHTNACWRTQRVTIPKHYVWNIRLHWPLWHHPNDRHTWPWVVSGNCILLPLSPPQRFVWGLDLPAPILRAWFCSLSREGTWRSTPRAVAPTGWFRGLPNSQVPKLHYLEVEGWPLNPRDQRGDELLLTRYCMRCMKTCP